MKFQITVIIAFLGMLSCQDPVPLTKKQTSLEFTSLSGQKLVPPKESKEIALRKDQQLSAAYLALQQYPDSLDVHIWYGRRLAYLYKYTEAITVYTDGIEQFPDSPELFRHRGHRYLTLRKFDLAIADFEKAAELVVGREIEIESDGMPNTLNKSLSNLQFNIWYHWGLAYYLKGNFEKAAIIFEECLEYSTNADLLVANVDWLYMSYRRLGLDVKANHILDKVTQDMIMIENDSYFKRILMYKGIFKPIDLLDHSKNGTVDEIGLVTQGYGVANYHYYNNEKAKANHLLKQIVKSDSWYAFGYIAAESELNR